MITAISHSKRYDFAVKAPLTSVTLPSNLSHVVGKIYYEIDTAPGSGTKTYSSTVPQNLSWIQAGYSVIICLENSAPGGTGTVYAIPMRR